MLTVRRGGIADNLRVAIVHYWFANRRGGERVVEAIAELFPEADLFALIADPEVMAPDLRRRKITTSFLSKLPGSPRLRRYLLPLYPYALEQFDLRGYDLVISSESGPAKGVLTNSQTCHVCYCHSPMRYIWELYHEYQSENGSGRMTRQAFALIAHYMRLWDVSTAHRVDHFIANSVNVAQRIWKNYRRYSDVVYPPVRVNVGPVTSRIGDHYLYVGQLVDYKRVDLAIEVCKKLKRRLRIVGDGEQFKRLRSIASPDIEFLGSLSDDDVRNEYASCRALLFPGEEDFGIVPVEAQSFGRPVVAYGRGGALETVVGILPGDRPTSDMTGVFSRGQDTDSFSEAIRTLEALEGEFRPEIAQRNASRFSSKTFREKMSELLEQKLETFHSGRVLPLQKVAAV
ncbi:MAG: glycosyltransferase [Acidobacteriaceae bacterium]